MLKLSPNGKKLVTIAPDLYNSFIKESQLIGLFSGSLGKHKILQIFKAEQTKFRGLVTWVIKELRTKKEVIKKLGIAGSHYHSWACRIKGEGDVFGPQKHRSVGRIQNHDKSVKQNLGS